jgi:hypothetical protein
MPGEPAESTEWFDAIGSENTRRVAVRAGRLGCVLPFGRPGSAPWACLTKDFGSQALNLIGNPAGIS